MGEVPEWVWDEAALRISATVRVSVMVWAVNGPGYVHVGKLPQECVRGLASKTGHRSSPVLGRRGIRGATPILGMTRVVEDNNGGYGRRRWS
jgi:hypothetical protein